MRKKLLLAAAVVLFIALGAAVGVGIMVFRIINGTESLAGSAGAIPQSVAELPPIEKGDSDWPLWRGENRDGKSSLEGIRKDWKGGLKKLWEIDYLCQGSGSVSWSAPVISGNRLVATGRSETQDLVFCLDPATGKLLWSGSYDAEAGGEHGPGPRASPCIDGDRVYTFGRSGDLACWALFDGKPIWKRNVSEEGGVEPRWGHSGAPLVMDGKVLVQAGGKAVALAFDAETGKTAWKSMEGPAGYAAVTATGKEGGDAVLFFHGGGLSALSRADGKELWTFPWKTNYDVNATTPVVAGDVVFITSGYGTGGAALKIGEGPPTVLWKNKSIASQHSDPIVVDGYLYGYSGDSSQNRGYLKCVSLVDGSEKWSTGEAGWGTLLLVASHLLCLDIEGNLYLVEASPEAFKKVAEHKSALGRIRHPAWTCPVVAGGRLFLRYMQRLLCFELAKG